MRSYNIVALLSCALCVAAAAAFAISVILVALGQFWIATIGNVSPVTVASVSGLYLLMNSRLRRDGVSAGLSIVLSILFANVFAQTFEVIYHFTFPVYLNYFRAPYLNGDDIRYLGLEGTMLLPVLLVRRTLRFGKVSAGLLLCFAVTWGIWILYGFPQYFATATYYPQVLRSSDPFHLSLILNFGSKAMLAAFFGSLAVGEHLNRSAEIRSRCALNPTSNECRSSVINGARIRFP